MTLDECTLYQFVKVICTNDVAFVGGNENWLAISEAYQQLKGQSPANPVFTINRKGTVLQNRIELTKILCVEITKNFDPVLVECLHILGYKRYTFEDVAKDVQSVITSLKARQIDLEDLVQELADIESKKKGKEVTEFDYVQEIQAYSKWLGYRIDWKITSVSEYEGIKELNKVERIQRQNLKKRTNGR